jgi:stringent starvation protein B
MIDSSNSTSTRPYLLRALYEWCADNGLTPYIAAFVDDTVQVPREYVKNNEIVLNISMDATSHLKLGNEYVEFKARFGGVAREIMVPISHVIAIYARENGQGMAFPVPQSLQPRGEVQEAPAKLSPKRPSAQGLHSVETQPALAQPQQAQVQAPTESVPSKIVSLKTPKLHEVTLADQNKAESSEPPESQESPQPPEPPHEPPKPGRPALTRVK